MSRPSCGLKIIAMAGDYAMT